jgi:hypothetical protein
MNLSQVNTKLEQIGVRLENINMRLSAMDEILVDLRQRIEMMEGQYEGEIYTP